MGVTLVAWRPGLGTIPEARPTHSMVPRPGEILHLSWCSGKRVGGEQSRQQIAGNSKEY